MADRDVRAGVLRASAAEILPAFVNAMAAIEPVLVETDHRELVTEIVTRVTRRSLIVILTGLDAEAITEGLIPVLGPLAAGRDDVGEVYAAAAAELEEGRPTLVGPSRHAETVGLPAATLHLLSQSPAYGPVLPAQER